jgi:FKBP-type peptidyl-prolyl cis-trans isomerase FkpA
MKQFQYLLILILIAACGHNSPYPGFSKSKHGIYYQLHKIGESEQKPQFGDYITADISYKTMSDSIFFNGKRKIQLTAENDYEGSINECFMMLAAGESATFILSANDFYKKTLESTLPPFLKENDKIKITLDIDEIQTKNDYQKEKEAFLNWIEDFGDYEKILLQQFLNKEKLPVQPTTSGMYCLKLKEGNGKKIMKGDTITINYEGKFLDGKYFDSTIRRNQPFQFVYGTEWQVIKGLDEAIGTMSLGEKSLFILPSDLAFGNEGSSTGIIPPFTSLIFEVEILAVN